MSTVIINNSTVSTSTLRGANSGIIYSTSANSTMCLSLKKIPAIMITDTSLFRNKNYHELTDLPDTLDYEKMAILVNDLVKIVKNIKLQ